MALRHLSAWLLAATMLSASFFHMGAAAGALDAAAGAADGVTAMTAWRLLGGSSSCFPKSECMANCAVGTTCSTCSEPDGEALFECTSPNSGEQAPLEPGTTCKDVKATDADPLALYCFDNVSWAMDTGITEDPFFYKNFTIEKGASFADFQCVLHKQSGADEAGTGHDCPLPCSSTMPICVPPTTTSAVTVTTTTTTEASGSSFPWWGWLLAGIALLGLIGGLLYYFLVVAKEQKPKKKKRAVKTAVKKTEALAPAPTPAPTPVLTAPPVYITSPQAMQYMPIQTMATPITTYTQAAAPALAPAMASFGTVSRQASPTYATPVATPAYTAAPTAYTAAPITYATSPAVSLQ